METIIFLKRCLKLNFLSHNVHGKIFTCRLGIQKLIRPTTAQTTQIRHHEHIMVPEFLKLIPSLSNSKILCSIS